MTITANEQLLLELINRARLDPLAEAARHGIDLNEGLSPGRISATPKQALANDGFLNAAATAHSQWMLDTDTFSHTGVNGSSATDRIRAAGYDLSGSWTTGENISYRGTTGTPDLTAYVSLQHQDLFLSSGHRANLMNDRFAEIGVAQVEGQFTSTRSTFNTSMVTQNFAASGNGAFLTGVAYDDRDGDAFYSAGEGLQGLRLSVGGSSAVTASAGGYQLETMRGVATVTIVSAQGTSVVDVDFSDGNVKLDVLGDGSLAVSGDMTLMSGASSARLLGAVAADLAGNDADNALTGNHAANALAGNLGNDTLSGGDDADTLSGGEGDDLIFGGTTSADLRDEIMGGGGNDTVDAGHGNDMVYGGSGDDALTGGFGADTLVGQSGNDVLSGGALSDALFGGDGNDYVNGGFGFDRVNGGGGADRFFHLGIAGHGSDWIQDYSAGEGDSLVFGGTGRPADFQVNFALTPGAGEAGTAEAFVIHRPTGQILWALVDGAAQGEILLDLGAGATDLLV